MFKEFLLILYNFIFFDIIFHLLIYRITSAIFQAALHIACEKNHIEIVKLLLEHEDIDVNLFLEVSFYSYYILYYLYYISSFIIQVIFVSL